jgi:hypothetical protein
LLIGLVLSGTISSVQAQNIEMEKHPGYIDLNDIRIPEDAEEVAEIDIGPGLLGILSMFSDEAEEDLKEDFSKLFSIRVKSFKLYDDDDLLHMRKIMEKKEKDLAKNKWRTLVRTKTVESISIISMKVEKKKTVGLFIMSLDEEGSVSFVNVVGGIDMETLSELGVGLSDSTMRALKENFKDN